MSTKKTCGIDATSATFTTLTATVYKTVAMISGTRYPVFIDLAKNEICQKDKANDLIDY